MAWSVHFLDWLIIWIIPLFRFLTVKLGHWLWKGGRLIRLESCWMSCMNPFYVCAVLIFFFCLSYLGECCHTVFAGNYFMWVDTDNIFMFVRTAPVNKSKSSLSILMLACLLTCIWALTPSWPGHPWSSRSWKAPLQCRRRWWWSPPWTPRRRLRERQRDLFFFFIIHFVKTRFWRSVQHAW